MGSLGFEVLYNLIDVGLYLLFVWLAQYLYPEIPIVVFVGAWIVICISIIRYEQRYGKEKL